MRSFLITGADFRNKGGQSMLFITINELRKRYPDCRIYYPTKAGSDKNFRVIPVYYDFNSLYYMHGGKEKLGAVIKALAKPVLGKKGNIKQIKELKRIYPKLDAIIDISGFNLSSEWRKEINFKFLEFIRQAKKYDIPVYLMPQSFGPFNYGDNQSEMDRDISELLSYCKIVYVRENDGYKLLMNKYKLDNAVLSPDLVLQNKEISLEAVFYNPPAINVPRIEGNSVAVIPNLRSIEHGGKDKLLELYKEIITVVRENGKKVYLFRHAFEDLEACKWIKELFPSDDGVIIFEEDFDCLEYSELVKQFDFIIASRFHAIVHALKQRVPCIALGWAVKYSELLDMFDMNEYVFNVKDKNNIGQIKLSVNEMCKNCDAYAALIESKLKSIQSDNCFDILDSTLR